MLIIVDGDGKIQQINDMKGDLDIEQFKQRIQQEGLYVVDVDIVPDMSYIYNFETEIFEPGN